MTPGTRVWLLRPGRPTGTYVSARAAADGTHVVVTVALDDGTTVEERGRNVFVVPQQRQS